MKRILSTLTLLLCFAFTAVNAQVITVERAAEIANSFFSAGVQKSGAARGVVASSGLTASFDSNDVTDAASANPTFYVLTNPEGGFVIVSGEETENPIIGYSFDGTIDANDLPDGFVDYMTDIDAQVKALREYNANNPQKAAARSAMQRAANFEYNATTMGEIVVDLKTAPWGQHGPFNKLCPVINGVNALTGCVPTAFAILCHYHKWPENGSGTYTNSGQTIDISTSTYDYASMRNDNYPSGQYTEAEANAVALLMRDLGFAYGVLYGTSSTDKSENATTLKSAFSYKSEYNPSGTGMDAMWRSSVGDETFIASLKECLDKKRPIPFSSKSIDPETGKGSIRHIFILDGYTKDNYFHFNYGWNGSGNGWYTIDFMQPDDDSDYSTEQRAYLDLIPNRTPRTVTVSANPAVAGTVTVNDNANSAEVTEGTYATLKAIANNGYTFSNWSNGSTDNPLKVKVEAEGNEYVANFLTVGNTTVNVSVSYNSSYGTVTQKNGSTISGTGLTPYLNSEVTLVATPLDGYVFNGWTVKKGTNSTPYSGTELTFIATEDMSVEADFSTAIATYNISEATGTLENSTSSRYTTWSSSEVLGLYLTASYNSNAVEAISFYNAQVKLISAIYEDKTSTYKNPITYTLSAPDGYVITAYSMTYKSSSSNYNMTVANAQMTQTLANRNEVLTLSATGLSAQNTSFTVSGANTNYAIQVQEFTVTLQSEGGGSTPTTYTIYATAGAGGSVTINGDAVSQKSVNENSTVTLVATPQTGYRFVNWTDANNGSEVSTSATYSYTATSNKSLVANFEQTQYTVTVAAGEGGSAYIGTKGTTEKTVSHNENVTITAEANDGYRFVEWRAWNSHFSSSAQQNVTVTTDVTYTAVFEAEAQEPEQPGDEETPLPEPEYSEPTGATYQNNYLTSVTTTGAIENVTYSASAHPGVKLLTVPGTVRVEKGGSFTLNLVAKSLSSSTSSVAEDMRYCHASLFTDFDCNGSFGSAIQTWGTKPPANNVAGNYSSVMNITHEITVPANAPLGTSHVRMIYTNAWTGWPTDGTAELDKGIAYDIVVEVVEPSNEKTLNVTYSGATWNNATGSWWESVTTTNEPAVTVATAGGGKAIGYSTVNEVRHPYLLDDNSFTISIPAPYKIIGYRLTYKTHNLNGKTFTCTGLTDPVTAGQDNVEQTIAVTGLENSAIEISVSDQSSQAGVIITALEITYVEDTDLETYTVAVTAGENGTATASAANVVEGDNVTLTATANTDYKFVGWYNGETKVSEANPYTFAVTSNISYEARFEELFPDGAYKVYWQADNRGYLAYHGTDYPNEAKLAGVTYSGCQNLHYGINDADLVWYLITASDGKRYLFEVATGKFLGVNTSVYDNGQANKLSTTEAWPIAVEPNTNSTRLGHYIITTMISGTKNLLCSGCGTPKEQHPVRWLVVNDNNQKDGGAPLQLIPVNDVTVSDDVMSAVRAVIEPRTFKFQAEIDGWRNDNPNTHLGTITIGGTAVKLTPEHLNASELTMPLNEGTALAFTRKYRGFEFNGFYIGSTSLGENPTLTADYVAAIDENNPLVAKFTATDDVTLFYDDDEFSYRIPAIVKTVKDDKHKLIAISDYRHSFDDIGRDNHQTGTTQVDLVIRTSEDNGATWTPKQTIAEGSQHFGYGDAAAVANGQDVLVMAVAGNVFYAYANSENPQQAYRIYSNDNGVTWEKENISSNMESLFPDYYGLFFGSGKLAVDPDFNGSGNARVYGAILMKDSQGERNYVLYSDNWGKTWNILGNAVAARQNEPKVEILPNGQILLSARRGGGRTFNVFTYTDKANNAGTWSTATNGCDNGGNTTNGEIICLDAKRPNGTPTKILLQSQPYGSDRRNVSIWYKEISENETYTASSIASGWTMGKQVSTQLSAYSAMTLQENGEIALFFEEAPCYGDDHTKGYSMVYVPLTIEEITGENFLNPNAVVEPTTVDVTLTDGEGNTYTHQFDYLPGDAAAIDAALMTAYPFITKLGENGNLEQTGEKAYTYTNTVTLPFKVSNANTTVWHNIYWPANTRENDYPVYLSASSKDDTYVPKVTGSYAYGNHPTYNTLDGNEKISWAIYNVNNGFEFIFKNKVTDKYIQVTSVADDHAQNVVYVENIKDATAFTIFNKPAGSDYYTPAKYALTAKVGETTGYLCSTSATGYNYATHYFNNSNNGYGHQGAWIEFVEAPDYQGIYDKLIADINNFGDGEGKYKDDNTISGINKDALRTMLFSDLTAQATAVQTVKDSYTEITLTVPAVNDVVPGSVKILNEPVSHKFVPKGNVTIEAVPAAGYRFVNWTRPVAQASAAARTAEARNSNVVSDQNPYTVTVSEALSLEANFEEIVVNATLTDAQGNTYNVQLSGFTTGITTATVAAKLKEAYPYITLGDNATLDNAAYTYSNNVTLPFKVSSLSDATKTYLHNIYYPSNNKKHSGYPNYIAAFNDEDNIVDMAESPDDAYGYNPTYNTMNGNPMISWAVYSVNNSFEFVFKNELTNKYIKVESVSSSTTNNVKFVDNAGDATAFTLLKDAGSYNGDYALVAKVGDATGYLCATSSSTNYVTHFDKNDHQGAWVKFVEVDYGQYIGVLDTKLRKFDVGDDKHMITAEIQPMIAALYDSGNITKSQFEAYFDAIDAMDAENWPKLSLTIAPDNSGTTTIAGEEGVTSKYVPTGDLTINATANPGYHFVSWTDGASEITTAEYIKTISGGKGDVIALTANFAKNSYTVSVTAGEGGSASASETTVEHGASVTLTATPSTGYSFAGWYDGENLISAEASYTFPVTSEIDYTARFNEVPTGTVAIHVTVASTDGTTVTNAVGGNVKAIIDGIGQEWATDADVIEGADVVLVATNDYGQKGYLFNAWYKSGVFVSNDLEITVQATETATYEARFFRGCVVRGMSNNNRFGYISSITLADGTSIGYDASNRAVVREGTTVKLNPRIENGYTVGNWTDVNSIVVSEDESLIIKVNEDVTYTANFEPVSYKLTVSANYDSYGTVNAVSDIESGKTIRVGNAMEATITATANTGYRFVNWTKGTDVVSYDAEYTVPAIADVSETEDTEYVAVFEEIGTYYRIAYNFEVPVAAKSAATRAVGDVQTLTISFANGSFDTANRAKIWTSNSDSPTVTLTATSNGNQYKNICKVSNGVSPLNLSLDAYPNNNHEDLDAKDGTTFTIAVDNEDYKITAYSISYNPYNNGYIDGHNNNQLAESGLNVSNVSFTVKGTGSTSAVDIQSFTVTIQQVGGEITETVKYYVQSEACGVSGKENALKMTPETDAASIFYYADNKLMSYAKGTYVNENGNTRGLQAVGVEGGDVTFESNKIKFTMAYMHAKESNGIYYVDNCGATATCGNDDHNFIIEKVTSLPVAISAAGYASWYAPVAVSLPSGIEAWYFDGKIGYKGEDKYAIMAPIGGDVVPANTGVILTGKDGEPAEIGTYYLAITDEVDPISGNKLEGTVAAQYVNKGKAYVLSKQNGQIGFYWATTAGQQENVFLNNSHKAYLPASNLPGDALQSAGFRFSFGGTTDIEEVETESSEVNAIYDLTGRKLEGISGAGIYIVNGKKVLVK